MSHCKGHIPPPVSVEAVRLRSYLKFPKWPAMKAYQHLRNARIITAIVLVSIIFSCSDHSTNPKTTINLIPMSPGNKWSLVRSYFDTLGNVTQSNKDSIYFLGDTLINDVKWTYLFQTTIQVGYRNSPDGVVIRLLNSPSNTGELLLYPTDAVLGKKYNYPTIWVGPDILLEDTSQTITLLSTEVDVQVPAGTFSCYHYRTKRREYPDSLHVSYREEFISPDHGWVRSIFYSRRQIGGSIFPANSLDLQSLRLE